MCGDVHAQGDVQTMDVTAMMKQARQMQEKVQNLQDELAQKTVEASAGGGMVSVVANGRQEIISVRIAPEVVVPDDVTMLEDLVSAAVNEALRSARALMQEEMTKITGGISIPGINA
jgi:DNA-binding YbaB/EbfC family protein